MQKWEYLVISIDNFGRDVSRVNNEVLQTDKKRVLVHEYLAEIGKDGWEVVASHPDRFIIAKRPLVEEP